MRQEKSSNGNETAEFIEQQMPFILQSAGIGTWSFFPQQKEVLWDDICKQLFGFSKSDVVDYDEVLMYIHPDDRNMVNEAVMNAVNPDRQSAYDITFRTVGAEDNLLRWLHCKGKAYFDERKTCYRFSGITLDITEKRRKDELLRDIEHRFGLAFENASVGIVITDAEGNFLLINKAYGNILGYTQEELYANSYLSITHPDDAGWNRDMVDSLRLGEIPSFNIDKRYLRKDGSTIWVNHQATLIEEKNGNQRTIFSIVRDISDEVKAREELELSLEGGELGLWHVDLPAKQVTLDAHCLSLLSLPADQEWYSYQQMMESIAEEDRETAVTKVLTGMSEGSNKSFAVEFKTAHTAVQNWVRMKGRITVSGGKPVHIAGTMQNISAQKQLQQYRDAFLGIASHELKTPVTTLKAYTQLVEMTLDDDNHAQEKTMMKQVNRQIDKLTSLITHLLDVTKLQSNKISFNEDLFNFTDMVNEVVDELQQTTTHVIIKKIMPVGNVYGDRERIAQVVTNLITNAIKYSPDAKQLVVHTGIADNKVKLCVEDFGIGIPAEKKHRVFDQYYRVSGSRQHAIPGLGLGLYISSEIIKREGGRIWVESSSEGKGSTFCFCIPPDHRLYPPARK